MNGVRTMMERMGPILEVAGVCLRLSVVKQSSLDDCFPTPDAGINSITEM